MKYRAQRYPTRFQVTLRVGAVGFPSMITSVSSNGARVTMTQDLGVGQDVFIEYAGKRVAANIRWVFNGVAGLTFDWVLPKADLDRIRFGLPGGGATRSHRVGFAAMRQ